MKQLFPNVLFATARAVHSNHPVSSGRFSAIKFSLVLALVIGICVLGRGQAPIAYEVTGTGSYCEGNGGLPVGVANSETGVTYALWKNTIATGSTISGSTGNSITFGNQSFGTYTVKGSNGTETTTMSGSAVITEVAAPTAYAGVDDFGTIGVPFIVSDATATNYSSLVWTTTGSGTLNNATTISPDYTPNAIGYITLTLTAHGNAPCADATDAMLLYSLPPSTDPVTWTGLINSNWANSSNWSPNFVPASVTDVTIPSTGITNFPLISGAAFCHNITINSGASLLGNSNLTVSGTSTVIRNITGGEWHLISSPVSGETSGLFTGMYLQTHTESTNLYTDITSTAAPLVVMKGYALYNSSGFTAQFAGSLNTGDKSYSTTYSGVNKGWNLVGNPYPSYIDWNASGWTKTNVNGSIYIHVNASTWATFNGSTGTNSGSRYIAPCQGFFVESSAGGNLGMTNNVRTNQTAPFFKNSDEVVPNLVRLQVTGNGYTDEAVVMLTPQATAEFDGQYDAHKLYGDVPEAPQIYTLGSSELAINALPAAQPVIVGMKVSTAGSYTITATEVNGLTDVALEDTKTGTFNKLADGAYTFDFAAGENEHRFILHFGALGINDPQSAAANIYAYNKTVYINMAELSSGNAFVCNVSGQLVVSAAVSEGMNRINLPSTGIYIVKVITGQTTLFKKVWIE